VNFISALKHATIGYGIRRKEWMEGHTMFMENDELFWTHLPTHPIIFFSGFMGLNEQDIAAKDWETI
jgi:hypothetical protein